MQDGPIVVELIPVDRITVLNPRGRSRQGHRVITDNIDAIGLKRPITVARRKGDDGSDRYDLVCGEGRLEAFHLLNQTEIPAVVLDIPEEDCLVMSLVENLARRQHSSVDLLREVGNLKQRGYSDQEIAEKIGCTQSWASMIAGLLDKGEERLLAAVESGLMPLALATVIARTDDAGIQNALAEAYADGTIKSKNVELVRRLLEKRDRRRGKPASKFGRGHGSHAPTTQQLLEVFEREASRQRLLIKKANFIQNRLLFLLQALKELRTNDGFINLLRAEQLDELPRALSKRMGEAA
jgi:ParB family chromosome partitioning protein